MTNEISNLPTGTDAIAHNDIIPYTDVSDNSEYPAGKTKKGTRDQVFSDLTTLNLNEATEITVSSGTLTLSQMCHKVQPESGTADDVDNLAGMSAGDTAVLYASDAGTDTLTFKHGTGNISCAGGADIDLSEGALIVYCDGTTYYISGGGGGGGASPLTTKGDLYAYDSADNRLPVGDDGLIPAADSDAALGISYVGGKVLLDSVVLESDTTYISFDLTSYHDLTRYKHLEIFVCARTDSASTGDAIDIIFNADSGAHYYSLRPSISHNAALSTAEQLASNFMTVITVTGALAPAGSFGVGNALIFCFNSSTKMKILRAYGAALTGTGTGTFIQRDGNGAWNQTSPITSIRLDPTIGTNFVAGTEVYLYGVTA